MAIALYEFLFFSIYSIQMVEFQNLSKFYVTFFTNKSYGIGTYKSSIETHVMVNEKER